jgi:Rieske Fe-S protein
MQEARCSCGMSGINCSDPSASAVLDRRDFLTQSLLTAVAGVLAGASIGCGQDLLTVASPVGPTTLGTALTFKLANFPVLANVGGIARVDGGTGTPLAIARTGASTFVAVSLVCTHQGTTVDIVSGGFKCPNHGATFGADGHWTGGQTTTNLVTYPVVYDSAAGTLQVGGSTATAVVATLSIQPPSTTLAAGQTVQLTATPADAHGATIPGLAVTWSSGNSSIASVASGLVTAVAAGSTTITATCQAVTAMASITVSTGQTAGGLAVDPALFPALATVGGIARVDNQQPGSTPIAVVRTGTNTWAAFSMVCPHQGTTINIVSGGFLCPNHGARFNTSGANIGGQTSGPLTTLPVTVQANGTLIVDGSSAPPPSGGGSDDGGSDG